MNARILIVEDEIKIAELLRDYLEAEGAECRLVLRGDEAEAVARDFRPDLVLLDLMLPGKSGMDICRALVGGPAIIMITARVEEIDRMLGLELGADDYVCKPFSPREVVARAKAVLRRVQKQESGEQIQLGKLRIDYAARQAWVDESELTLTPLEFEMLRLFLSRPNEVHSRARLLNAAKGSDYAGYERNIDSHMKNLRKKLRAALQDADPFHTVYGAGYRLNHEALR